MCSLSFALLLEPLAQRIRQHPAISPITFCNTSHHILLFADDILLYVDNAPTSIPQILDTFEEFGALSGYVINWSKSSLLPLNSSFIPSTIPSYIPMIKSFKIWV